VTTAAMRNTRRRLKLTVGLGAIAIVQVMVALR
jgi:hypothetical protein